MSSASTIFVTAMLWGKISRPAPRVSTLVPFILSVSKTSICRGVIEVLDNSLVLDVDGMYVSMPHTS